MRPALLLLLLLGLAAWGGPAAAGPKAADLVRVDLAAEPSAAAPGEPFMAAVRLRMAPHWHTYWRNPGDSGLATEIAWTLPDGWKAGPIRWPVPHRIEIGQLVNYGFETEATLLVDLTPPANARIGTIAELSAKVTYLVCERECIPGEATVGTSLPVAAEPGPVQAEHAARFAAARAAEPQPAPWASAVTGDAERLTLKVAAPGLRADAIRGVTFFPIDDTAVEHAAPQPFAVDGEGLTVTLRRSNLSTGAAPATLSGVLVLDEALGDGVSRQAFALGDPDTGAGSGATTAGSVSTSLPAPAPPAPTLLLVLNAALFAFLGGLVLNLMPCVFPVLSIKVLSLVRHSGGERRTVRLAALAYTAGVVASFLALAALLLGVRAAGAEVGWGFQLQSPAVVAAVAFLLLAVGLSLSGVYEFGAGLAARAGSVGEGHGLAGSFGTGALAAAVATPCTAPFMGAAVGFALTAPVPAALGVFAALGLGMAAPFLLLAFRPSLLSRLPRPGGWMETLKQALAFPIYATVAWLVFVLSQQVGPAGLFAALIGLVLVGFAAWAWREGTNRQGIGRPVGRIAAAMALLAIAGAGWAVERDAVAPGAAPERIATAEGAPEPFSQARLDALRSEGRPVFVNMTAAWCITCMVNERTSLSTASVKARMKEANVAYLKGDWTNQNPEITRLLEQNGRSGVPLYVLYAPRTEPLVLPQILTETTVLDSLGALPIAAASTKRAEMSPRQPGAIR